jgi:hypothetical protein
LVEAVGDGAVSFGFAGPSASKRVFGECSLQVEPFLEARGVVVGGQEFRAAEEEVAFAGAFFG